MSSKSLIPILCLALAVVAVPALAVNLLTNGDFETGPYGSQAVPGWAWWGVDASNLFDGVFDSTWNVPPPCNPTDPSNYGPHGGTYYLGRYYKPQPCEVPGGGKTGALHQQVDGLTPGTTYYAQAWFATHHPHGGGAGFRIGVDPEPGDNPSLSIVWSPAVDPVKGNQYAYSEAAYKKLEAAAQAGATGSVAVWLQYTTTSNNISQPQIVQVDDARLAATHSMEIQNIDVVGASATIAQIFFDTFDGSVPPIDQRLRRLRPYGFIRLDQERHLEPPGKSLHHADRLDRGRDVPLQDTRHRRGLRGRRNRRSHLRDAAVGLHSGRQRRGDPARRRDNLQGRVGHAGKLY